MRWAARKVRVINFFCVAAKKIVDRGMIAPYNPASPLRGGEARRAGVKSLKRKRKADILGK